MEGFPACGQIDDLTPFVIVDSDDASVSAEYVESQLSCFASTDDVYSDYFSDR